MEFISTTPELANELILSGKRKIYLKNKEKVVWINLKNDTLMTERRMYDIEDVELFIGVTSKSKTIF